LSFTLPAAGCRPQAQPVSQEGQALSVVSVAEAKERTISRAITAVGTLAADEEVTISAEVEGPLSKVLVEEGQAANRGDTLAIIDETDYRLRLQEAEATYAQTKADLGRKEALFQDGIISPQQYDEAKARFALAEAQAQLARERLKKARITAPLAGRVKAKKVSAGEYVRAGAPLFILIRTHPLKLIATVPEKQAAQIRVGQKVRVEVDAHPGRSFEGQVSLLAPHIEEATRSMKLEARIPNPKGELKPGLFSRAAVLLKEADRALLVPAQAVQSYNDTLRAFVVVQGAAREVRVKTGDRFGPDVEVLQGLKPGDRVVVSGHQNLSEGVQVQVK
jgi:membrane fusion protein (multidrug efflux system)